MRIAAPVLLTFVLLGPVLADPEKPTSTPTSVRPLKALLITGGCCHDYEGQTRVLREGLGRRLHIELQVAPWNKKRDSKLEIYEKDDWAKGFDVVIHNECYGGVTDVEYVERIARPHLEGKPAVVLHCSMHSYRNAKTDAWRKVLGVTSRRHEGKRPYKVEVLEKDHPVVSEFPSGWLPPNGELYQIEKVWPGCQPLARAYGKDTKKYHVVVWAHSHPRGRTFGTTIGHHTETMAQPEFLDLVSRGLLWACGKLDPDGTVRDGLEKKAPAEAAPSGKEAPAGKS